MTKKSNDLIMKTKNTIHLSRLAQKYMKSNLSYRLPIILGENKAGKSHFVDLVDLKHILMTGSTGSGKSMFEHIIISTLLSSFTPSQLRLYLVDMKLVEFNVYNGLPHLLAPASKDWDPEKIYSGLKWLHNEKDIRLKRKNEIDNFPYIVVIIDTFSDLMAHNSQQFQEYISKLIDNASEVKIHVIMSDSRASTNLFTPLIKNLFPTKICFNTYDAEASKLIIGADGGEKLLGNGDMLFLPPNSKKAINLQAPYISDEEIRQQVSSAKKALKNK